jgi:hypothetical protein
MNIAVVMLNNALENFNSVLEILPIILVNLGASEEKAFAGWQELRLRNQRYDREDRASEDTCSHNAS